jgi:hypothetical protein
MPVAKKYHYFLINQLGQSVDRRGPFVSAAAATEWCETNYQYPCWIVAAEPVGLATDLRPLDKNGMPVQEV